MVEMLEFYSVEMKVDYWDLKMAELKVYLMVELKVEPKVDWMVDSMES